MSHQPIRVATICTGNICRSPMAEVVLRHLIADDPHLQDHVMVTSAGTANWHVGSPMDPRARAALDRAGYVAAGTAGAFADADYLDLQDLIVVMTREHRGDVQRRLNNAATEVILWRDLINEGEDLDVADPYYGGDDEFDECLAILRVGGQHLTSLLRARVDARARDV
ncbi:MAG: low molecular weight protein-tyrosine-phosphatase [Acidimicrobiales bacterium]